MARRSPDQITATPVVKAPAPASSPARSPDQITARPVSAPVTAPAPTTNVNTQLQQAQAAWGAAQARGDQAGMAAAAAAGQAARAAGATKQGAQQVWQQHAAAPVPATPVRSPDQITAVRTPAPAPTPAVTAPVRTPDQITAVATPRPAPITAPSPVAAPAVNLQDRLRRYEAIVQQVAQMPATPRIDPIDYLRQAGQQAIQATGGMPTIGSGGILAGAAKGATKAGKVGAVAGATVALARKLRTALKKGQPVSVADILADGKGVIAGAPRQIPIDKALTIPGQRSLVPVVQPPTTAPSVTTTPGILVGRVREMLRLPATSSFGKGAQRSLVPVVQKTPETQGVPVGTPRAPFQLPRESSWTKRGVSPDQALVPRTTRAVPKGTPTTPSATEGGDTIREGRRLVPYDPGGKLATIKQGATETVIDIPRRLSILQRLGSPTARKIAGGLGATALAGGAVAGALTATPRGVVDRLAEGVPERTPPVTAQPSPQGITPPATTTTVRTEQPVTTRRTPTQRPATPAATQPAVQRPPAGIAPATAVTFGDKNIPKWTPEEAAAVARSIRTRAELGQGTTDPAQVHKELFPPAVVEDAVEEAPKDVVEEKTESEEMRLLREYYEAKLAKHNEYFARRLQQSEEDAASLRALVERQATEHQNIIGQYLNQINQLAAQKGQVGLETLKAYQEQYAQAITQLQQLAAPDPTVPESVKQALQITRDQIQKNIAQVDSEMARRGMFHSTVATDRIGKLTTAQTAEERRILNAWLDQQHQQMLRASLELAEAHQRGARDLSGIVQEGQMRPLELMTQTAHRVQALQTALAQQQHQDVLAVERGRIDDRGRLAHQEFVATGGLINTLLRSRLGIYQQERAAQLQAAVLANEQQNELNKLLLDLARYKETARHNRADELLGGLRYQQDWQQHYENLAQRGAGDAGQNLLDALRAETLMRELTKAAEERGVADRARALMPQYNIDYNVAFALATLEPIAGNRELLAVEIPRVASQLGLPGTSIDRLNQILLPPVPRAARAPVTLEEEVMQRIGGM